MVPVPVPAVAVLSVKVVAVAAVNVAVTVQFTAGMTPVKVVIPDPPHPLTLVRVDPPVAVTVQE